MSPFRTKLVELNPGRTRSSAFTLIELMVTVTIIGILIAIVLTVIPKVKRAVQTAETQAELSALSNAIQQYYNDFKAYPGPLPNSQLCAGKDVEGLALSRSSYPAGYGSSPNTLTALPFSMPQDADYNPGTFNYASVTSTQNLTLGLLGGLELHYPAGSSLSDGWVFNPQDITSDGVTPAPRGPAGLNPSLPRRYTAYIQVKPGDLSTPRQSYNGGAGASFADSALRSPSDAMIPVFVDKYADPLPILYYRTNPGAQAICGFRNTSDGSAYLVDNNGNQVNAQYDLWQNLPYVTPSTSSSSGAAAGAIGTTLNNPNSVHGLQAPGSPDLSDPIVDPKTKAPFNMGSNAIAYFKDPSANPVFDASATNPPSNTSRGIARQKDGYLLISAGPDRLYGSTDDVVFPGPLLPAQ